MLIIYAASLADPPPLHPIEKTASVADVALQLLLSLCMLQASLAAMYLLWGGRDPAQGKAAPRQGWSACSPSRKRPSQAVPDARPEVAVQVAPRAIRVQIQKGRVEAFRAERNLPLLTQFDTILLQRWSHESAE